MSNGHLYFGLLVASVVLILAAFPLIIPMGIVAAVIFAVWWSKGHE